MCTARDGGRHSLSQSFFEPLEDRRHLSASLLTDAAGLSAAQSVTVNGVSYFFADQGSVGRELWKSDGTSAGTSLVRDLTPGAGSTTLHSMYDLGGRAVFIVVSHHPRVDGSANDDYSLWS